MRSFLYGSISPDAGYFPRCDRLFSELAHLSSSGDLCRALLDGASSPVQRAHAWGWITHVLGDLAIHPLINAAHGEWLHGDRSRPVTSSEDEVGHMRLEYGLDVAVFAAFPELDAVKMGPAPGADGLAHIGRAYRRTYGWAPEERSVLAAHDQARRAAYLCRLTNRVHTAHLSKRRVHALARFAVDRVAPPRRWMPAAWNRSATARAALAPLSPPEWLIHEVSQVVEGIGSRVDTLRAEGLAGLANHDLVTGAPELTGAPTPRSASALRALSARKTSRSRNGIEIGSPSSARQSVPQA